MSSVIKSYRNKLMQQFKIFGLYNIRRSGYLKNTGWYRSVNEGQCVDKDGVSTPWFTYPATSFLSRRVTPDLKVFEFGSGASTRWWASHVSEVVAVEHDKIWSEKIKVNLPSNAKLFYIPLEYGGAYSQKINEFQNYFDIVVIDGRDRVNCAINSISALKQDGVIIWDNSDRDQYQKGYQHLLSLGFKKIEFVGMAPMIGVTSETSLFYRTQNCFGI